MQEDNYEEQDVPWKDSGPEVTHRTERSSGSLLVGQTVGDAPYQLRRSWPVTIQNTAAPSRQSSAWRIAPATGQRSYLTRSQRSSGVDMTGLVSSETRGRVAWGSIDG